MTEHSSALGAAADLPHRKPFLSTPRAITVCTRELAQLTTEVVDRVTALQADGIEEKAVVRRSPGRLIVQLGPVALTIAWLRSTPDVVEEGELLAIVWRGLVAPPGTLRPEQQSAWRAAGKCTQLWEEALSPVADDEASWVWQLASESGASFTSSDVASRCVDRLRAAYQES